MGFASYCFTILASTSTIEMLEGLRRGIVNSKLGAMGSIATVIAALLCGAVFLKISHDYLSGRGITLWEIVRPLVLLVLCANFNTFVAGPLHATCNLMTKSMSRTVNISGSQVTKKLGAAIKKQFENSQAATVENVTSTVDLLKTTWQNTVGTQETFGGKLKWGFVNALVAPFTVMTGIKREAVIACDFVGFSMIIGLVESVLYWLMRLFMFGQQVYCYVYLSILTLLGPFAFALGVYPGFQHSVNNWIARYVQICFWIPVGQLVMYCNYWMLDHLTDFGAGATFGDKWLVVAGLIVCLLNIRAVPQIASFVVESAGDSGAMSQSHGMVRETFQTVGSLKSLVGRIK